MLRQLDPKKMNAYPVSDLVNDPEFNDAKMIVPIGIRLQMEQQSLPKLKSNNGYYHKKRDVPEGSWGESRKQNKE